jgi:hypothetical protein
MKKFSDTIVNRTRELTVCSAVPQPTAVVALLLVSCGPGSSVGIATGYGLEGLGIESRWGRDFSHLSRPALGPTQPLYSMDIRSFPGVESGRGVTLTPHP